MKVSALIVAGVLVLMSLGRVSQADPPNWNLHVVLVDGSRIIGSPKNTSLEVDLGFGALEIPLKRIRRADFQDGGRTIRIELTNEDVVTGTIRRESFQLETIFGTVTLLPRHCKSLEVRPKNLLGWLPTTRGLALYYSFDRVGDGVVTNLAGDKHVGKLNGTKWTREGLRGGAVELGRSTRIEVPHDPDLCPPTMTLAVWLKPHGDQSGYRVIVGKTAASSWHDGYAFVRMPGQENKVHFFVNSYTESMARAEMPSEGWSHVAGVCDGTHVTIYVNGKKMDTVPLRKTSRQPRGEESEDAGSDSSGVAAPRDQAIRHSLMPLYIGSDARGYAWNGTLDELVLYRRALSSTEIQRLYEATAKQR